MSLQFTVETEVGIFGERKYRLQQDNSWRRLQNWRDIQPHDIVVESVPTAVRYLKPLTELEIEHVHYPVNPKSFSLGDNVTFAMPRVHRHQQLRDVSKKEPISVLPKGNDKRTNVLVLDLEGRSVLWDFSIRKSPLCSHCSAK